MFDANYKNSIFDENKIQRNNNKNKRNTHMNWGRWNI